ncbi:MAG: C39 family peptidase [Acidobacteriota bacterium]|nr:C39 family peptidase [Acidobacteriota bacterium]
MAMFKISPAIKPLRQVVSSTCWLTCLEMMVQWKNDQGDMSKKKWEIRSKIDSDTDYWSDYLADEGIAPGECYQVARALGMQPTGAGDYTKEILYDLISKKGPLWVGGHWYGNSAHVIVVTGVDPQSGKIKIADPYNNFDLSEGDRDVGWLNARGKHWKSYEGTVMYWR